MRIKKPSLDARVITVKQWLEQCADLDELIRPIVLRVNEARGLVTIRPRTAGEILEIKKKRGLPLDAAELVVRSGSLASNPQKLVISSEGRAEEK